MGFLTHIKTNIKIFETKIFLLKKVLFLLTILNIQFLYSQQQDFIEIRIDAQVLDYDTQKVIPFSEIKFLNKHIGALTDNEGKFYVNYLQRTVSNDDFFTITAYGYDTIKTTVGNLYKFLNNTNKFFLKKANDSSLWFNYSNYLVKEYLKNSLIEAKSDFEGFFKIKADLNDILTINYLGMIEKQILIENLNDKYILLKTYAQILDHVTITGTTELSDEVQTGYGKKKKKSVGFSTSTIPSEDISPGAVSIVDAIRGKFANVQISYNQYGAATGNKSQIYSINGTSATYNQVNALTREISLIANLGYEKKITKNGKFTAGISSKNSNQSVKSLSADLGFKLNF